MGFPRHQSALVLASFITVGSFLAATAYTQYRLVTLDDLSSTIETNAAPSVEYLGRAGVGLRRVRQLLYDGLKRRSEQSAQLTAARSALGDVEQDVANYLQLTPLPGELPLWDALRADVSRATNVARSVLRAEEEGDTAAAAELLQTEAEAAFDRADRSMLAALEFDVSQSQQLARDVRDIRRATLSRVVLLDAFATAVAGVAAFIAFRASRHHDQLLNAHSSLLAARVAELDQFSGRVAHDILSPLNTVAVGLALLSRTADSDARTHIDRAQKGLRRVQELVQGLLAFAQSASAPASDARCALHVVLANVAADFSEAAREQGIDLVVEQCDHIDVACSAGVLTSVAQNLVGNAIKYMGDSAVRRVTIRATSEGQTARLNVEDTGPGIDAAVQEKMFQPFVRGQHHSVPGFGLGLATVKRLIEAHGGTVGVKSTTGSGTVFWIELPLARGVVQTNDARPRTTPTSGR